MMKMYIYYIYFHVAWNISYLLTFIYNMRLSYTIVCLYLQYLCLNKRHQVMSRNKCFFMMLRCDVSYLDDLFRLFFAYLCVYLIFYVQVLKQENGRHEFIEFSRYIIMYINCKYNVYVTYNNINGYNVISKIFCLWAFLCRKCWFVKILIILIENTNDEN